jgi:hypothetical protein
MKRAFSLSPFLTISFCCVAYGFLHPPITLPILLFIPPTLAVNLLLDESDGLLTPAGLALSTGLFFLVSSALAVLHAQGRGPTISLVLTMTSVSLVYCLNQRRRLRLACRRAIDTSSPQNIPLNLIVLFAVLAYFIYSLKFAPCPFSSVGLVHFGEWPVLLTDARTKHRRHVQLLVSKFQCTLKHGRCLFL